MDQELKDILLSMQREIRGISRRMDTMEDDIQSVKADVAQIPTMQDRLAVLLDGMSGMNEKFSKLDKVAEDVEEIKIKVSALENVTKDNTAQIKDIRIVK